MFTVQNVAMHQDFLSFIIDNKLATTAVKLKQFPVTIHALNFTVLFILVTLMQLDILTVQRVVRAIKSSSKATQPK